LSIASTAMRALAPRTAIPGQSRTGRLCLFFCRQGGGLYIHCRISADSARRATGNTTLANALAPLLNAVAFNAGAVRANLSRDLRL
jgi:hypothetical protein